MARYKKGQSGNPAGKPKGAVNKITKDMRELHEQIITAIQEEIGISELIKGVKKDVLVNYIAKVMPKDLNLYVKRNVKELLDELIKNSTKQELEELLNNDD